MRTWGFWHTEQERTAAQGATGVFFGALIGANLARAPELPLWLYGLVTAGAGLMFVIAAAARHAPGRLRKSAILIMAALIAIAASAEFWGAGLPQSVRALLATTAVAFALWFSASWYIDMSPVRTSGAGTADVEAPGTAAPPARSPPVSGASVGRFSVAVIAARGLAAVAIVIAATATVQILLSAGRDLPSYLLEGTGVYDLVLLVLAAGLASSGISLARDASSVLPGLATLLERDDRAVRRHAAWALSGVSLGLALVLHRQAQLAGAEAAVASPAGAVMGRTIGFFDLVTWIGTFVTLGVVVAGALVAIYAKRREDEARRSEALRGMRQAWIDKVRDALVVALGEARRLREASQAKRSDEARAGALLGALRALELRINPAEDHHSVLTAALVALAKESGIDAQLAGRGEEPVSNATEWHVLTTWVTTLGQLVLKIEWIVTSLGPDAVLLKAEDLWTDLQKFEQTHAAELARLAPDAWRRRRMLAPRLINSRSEPSTDR